MYLHSSSTVSDGKIKKQKVQLKLSSEHCKNYSEFLQKAFKVLSRILCDQLF